LIRVKKHEFEALLQFALLALGPLGIALDPTAHSTLGEAMMNHVTLGLLLGLAAGVIVVALMMPMTFPEKRTALTAAFVSRFSIGFLTANTILPINPIATGVIIGVLLSIPDALITKTYVPILVIGTILGALCGGAVWFWG
jgi:hypothetical protein